MTMKLMDYTEKDLTDAKRRRSDALQARATAVSDNRSLRMLRKPLVAVPDKPEDIYVPCAYYADGGWAGRVRSMDECPIGTTIKWEKAL